MLIFPTVIITCVRVCAMSLSTAQGARAVDGGNQQRAHVGLVGAPFGPNPAGSPGRLALEATRAG